MSLSTRIRSAFLRWKSEWLIALLLFVLGVLVLKLHDADWRRGVVNSDGRGYYYFLPAIASGDFTYENILQQEEEVIGKSHQPYILNTESGRKINKCYPGVALMQLPSYLLASGVDYLSGEPAHAYSDAHLYAFYWTNVLFLFLGMILMQRNLSLYFGAGKYYWILVVLTVFGTNLAYQSFFYPGISHHYTFLLFNLWVYCLLLWRKQKAIKYLVILAVISGFMVLVRPTNVLLFIFLPFFLGTAKETGLFFREVFSGKQGRLPILVVLFGLTAGILPLLIYSQTGKWFYWSYQGEGFFFNGAHFLETWFSYRAGIFVHTPLVLFGVVGAVIQWRKQRFALSWLFAGLLVVSFILSSWWCWDYQLFFGHRGFTEYQFLTAFLLVFWVQSISRTSLAMLILLLPFGYMLIRTYQKVTGIYPVQKFTSGTYWRSFLDFDRSVPDKYYYFTNCQPYGKLLRKDTIPLSTPVYQHIDSTMEFWPDAHYVVAENERGLRYYADVHVNKKLLQSDDWKDVILVFFGKDANDSLVHYAPYPLYHYYREGKEQWIGHDMAEEFVPAVDGTHVLGVYIWNPKHKDFEIDDFRVVVSVIGGK